DSFIGVKITATPAAGTMTLVGTGTVGAGQVIPISAIVGGSLKFRAANNGFGAGYTSFTFQVQDSGAVANSFDLTARPLTIDVTGVNDPPVGQDKTVSTQEDVSYTFAADGSDFATLVPPASFDPTDNGANAFNRVKIVT